MLTYPFHPSIWNGNPYSKPYRLAGYYVHDPSPEEFTRVDYAHYSKNYWDGVRLRNYNHRMLKKIEYQDALKRMHG